MSFGLSELAASDDVESLLARIDQAMYQAKESGWNRVVFLPAA